MSVESTFLITDMNGPAQASSRTASPACSSQNERWLKTVAPSSPKFGGSGALPSKTESGGKPTECGGSDDAGMTRRFGRSGTTSAGHPTNRSDEETTA